MQFHKHIKKFLTEQSPVSWGLLIAFLGLAVTGAFTMFATKGQANEIDKRVSSLEQQLPPINEQLGHISGKVDEMDEILKGKK